MKNPFLTGNIIYLSPISKEDISDEYTGWLNDSEVCSENPHAIYPNTYEATLDYIESAGKSKNEIVFAIKWKKNDEHIGNISIQNINSVSRSAEIEIIIGNKKYRDKGVGSEAYELIINYGFNTLNLNRISSVQTISNKEMVNVCVMNGMKKEGMLREFVFKNGKYTDLVIYSILLKEFINLKKIKI